MKRSKLLTIAVITLLLVNLATLGFLVLGDRAQGPPNRPLHGEGPKQIIIDRLGFDDAQQKAYFLTIEAHRRKIRALEHTSRIYHQQLFALLSSNNYSQRSDSLIALIATNQRDMDHVNFDHFIEIKALCKPEQIERFNLLANELAGLFAPEGPPH